MIGIAVELMAECAGCQRPVALNSVVPNVKCPHCSRTMEIDPSQWKMLLAPALDEGPKLRDNEGHCHNGSLGSARSILLFRRMHPCCRVCNAGLALTTVLQEARTTHGWARCARCGAWLAARSPPVPLAPGVVALLGEDLGEHAAAQTTTASQPAESCRLPPASFATTRWYLIYDESVDRVAELQPAAKK